MDKKPDLKYEQKKIRREIIDEFAKLPKDGGNIAFAEFLATHKDHLSLVREALSPYRNSKNDQRANMIWSYLNGTHDDTFRSLVESTVYLQLSRNSIDEIIPDTIEYNIPVTEQGPDYTAVNERQIALVIQEYIGDRLKFTLQSEFPFFLPRRYDLRIKFENLTYLDKSISLVMNKPTLDEEDYQSLDVVPFPINEGIKSQNDLEAYLIHFYDDSIPSHKIDPVDHYRLLTRLMRTIYDTGFWSTEWACSYYREWKQSYSMYAEVVKYEEITEHIEKWVADQGIILLPDSLRQETNKGTIETYLWQLLRENFELPEDTFSVRLESNVNDSTLKASLMVLEQPHLSIYLFNHSQFLPEEMLNAIRQFPKTDFQYLERILDKDEYLTQCDQETLYGLKFDGYSQQAIALGSLCHVMLSRLSDETTHIQFKRTLTAFYAARASEYFYKASEQDNLIARRYFLLYFHMLYRENMIGYMKSIRDFETQIIATLMATYIVDKNLRGNRGAYIRFNTGHSDVEIYENRYILERCVQLWIASPQSFFEALQDMYLINSSFVDSMLVTLRTKVKRVGRYTTDIFYPDSSSNFPYELTHFLLHQPPNKVDNRIHLAFAHYMLDTKVVMYEMHNIEPLFEQSRNYILSENFDDRIKLYTIIEGNFRVAEDSVHKLTWQLRQKGSNTDDRTVLLEPLSRLESFIKEVWKHIDHIHKDLFIRTELEVIFDDGRLPHNMSTPVEVCIMNKGYGKANNVKVVFAINPSCSLEEDNYDIGSIGGKQDQYIQVFVFAKDDKTVRLSGYVEYSDTEMHNKRVALSCNLTVFSGDTYPLFTSPYIPGEPVRDSQMFYGRRPELDEIIRHMRGRYQDRSIVIHGRRRVGKTSILAQIMHGDANQLNVPQLSQIQKDYVIVYIDFEHLPQEYYAPYYTIYQNINTALRRIGYGGITIQRDIFKQDDPVMVLGDFIQEVSLFLEPTKRKLLIMCDEFDYLLRVVGQSEDESTKIFGYIRKLIMEFGHVIVFIFVGAEQLVQMMAQHAQRLYQISGEPIEIQPLTREEAVELIVRPMEIECPDFEWSTDAINYLFHLTQGHPYYIQAICDQVVNDMRKASRLRATWSDINNAVNRSEYIFEETRTLLTQINSPEKVIMSCVAELNVGGYQERRWVTSTDVQELISRHTTRFPINSIPKLMQSLRNRYILVEEQGVLELKYSIKVPLLQIYLANNLRVRDVILAEGYQT